MPLDIQGKVPNLPNCLLPCSCKFGSGGASCSLLGAMCLRKMCMRCVVCILPECTSAAVLGLCGIMHLDFRTVWLSVLDKLLLDNGHMLWWRDYSRITSQGVKARTWLILTNNSCHYLELKLLMIFCAVKFVEIFVFFLTDLLVELPFKPPPWP